MSEPIHPEVVILNAALDLPLAQRAVYLARACAGDDALRRQIETLLQASEEAGTFFEAPSEMNEAIRMTTPFREKVGDKIGRYKLLQQIGEGGCGVVYMAEQEESLQRHVALKVIKLGMDTKGVIA